MSAQRAYSERRILAVDLGRASIDWRPAPADETSRVLGGRGLNIWRLLEETAWRVKPLAAAAPLLFACGPLSGTGAPAASRVEVTARSPITGGVGTGSAGSSFAHHMGSLGIAQIVIRGKARRPVALLIDRDGASLIDASHLWGLDTWEAYRRLHEQQSCVNACIACIGPAGERQVPVANIVFDRYRAAGRGGLGAVMGSKRLKAVIVCGERSTAEALAAFPLAQAVSVATRTHPRYADPDAHMALCGVEPADRFGYLATRNFSSGTWEGLDEVNTEAVINRHVVARNLDCGAGCPTPCDSRFVVCDNDPEGSETGRGLKLESLLDLGARLDLRSAPEILHLTNEVNRLGLDLISTTGVIGFAIECAQRGVFDHYPEYASWRTLHFGDYEAVSGLMQEIAARSGLGCVLGQGSGQAARTLGHESWRWAVSVKDLDVSGVDPRGCQGWGLVYAVSSRGACHTRALAMVEPFVDRELAKEVGHPEWSDPSSTDGKAAMVIWHEDLGAVADSAPFCKFLTSESYTMTLADIAALLNDMETAGKPAGGTWDETSLRTTGERILNLERLFNLRCGLTAADDTLPWRFLSEPIPRGTAKGRVVELAPMLAEYYGARGWDAVTGVPTKSRLRSLGLAHLGSV